MIEMYLGDCERADVNKQAWKHILSHITRIKTNFFILQ